MPENGTHHASKGERIARLEAKLEDAETLESQLQAQLDRRLSASEKLVDEKLLGDRREADAIHNSLKEAISKVEEVTDRRFETAAQQAERREGLLGSRVDTLDARIQALERGDAGSRGVRQGITELKASTVAWVGAIAAVGLVLLSALTTHVLG
ncbi:MAG TPA: hypothetical protein VMT20_07125 [Terriglobia bacterium]|nr:hypothetical protein [Terriglobia bacterium]